MKYPDHVGNVWAWLTRLYEQLAVVLQARGYHVILAFPELTPTPAVPTPRLPRAQMQLVGALGGVDGPAARWLTDHHVQLILYADVEPSQADLPLLRRLGIRTVNYVHYNFAENQPPALPKRWLNHLRGQLGIRHHDLYIAVSASNERFLRQFAGIPARRTRLVLNGIDVDRFSPGPKPAPAALGVPVSQRYAVLACQSRPEKRVDFLIDVAADIFRRQPDLPLTFLYVGDGGERIKWEAQARQAGLGARFYFAGYQPDPLPFYRIADLFLHAPARESFGLVVAEAMATGLPAVCSQTGGPMQIIEPERSGFLLPAADQAGFAATILRLLQDDSLRHQIGQAARQRIVTHFDVRQTIAELSRALLELLPPSSSVPC